MLSSVDELAYDAEISEMRSILYARAEEERQKAETRANASAARVVRMGEELRDCMGAAKVALHSVLTRLGAPMSVALPEADAKAFWCVAVGGGGELESCYSSGLGLWCLLGCLRPGPRLSGCWL